MSGLSQSESKMFFQITSNYTCIPNDQAKELAKMITTNSKILGDFKYSGTSFDLYTSDSFVQTVKTVNKNSQPKKKQSELDAIIDEDSFPIKMPKTIFDKFADWLSGFEIPDDVEPFSFKDLGFDEKETPFGINIEQDYGIFNEAIPDDVPLEGEEKVFV